MVAKASKIAEEMGHAQRERLRFIESSLLWEGALRRQRVSDVFDVSLNHVTKDLRRYEDAFPNNILFDHRRQAYVPGPRFRPQIASRDPREYLALQLAHAESGSNVIAPLLAGWDTVPTATVPAPPHGISEATLKTVVRAISQHACVDALYHSSRGRAPGRRLIWPHALVHTGVRWHVRAYDDLSKAYRNFALQRIDDARLLDKSVPAEAGQDELWSRTVIVKVIPNPKLNQHQRDIVIRDFGMKQGTNPHWAVELRCSMVGYFVAQYGLDPKRSRDSSSRILLENPGAVEEWLIPEGT